MNTLDRSLDTLDGASLQCRVVSALEERVWLDRREDPCVFFHPKPQGLGGRLRSWFRRHAARTQLGPVADDDAWPDRHREDRF